MEDVNRTKREFNIDCSDINSKSELLKATYRQLEFFEYLNFANLDGLYDLMAPDLFGELNEMTIRFQNWNKAEMKIGHKEAESIRQTFQDIQSAWSRDGKVLEILFSS